MFTDLDVSQLKSNRCLTPNRAYCWPSTRDIFGAVPFSLYSLCTFLRSCEFQFLGRLRTHLRTKNLNDTPYFQIYIFLIFTNRKFRVLQFSLRISAHLEDGFKKVQSQACKLFVFWCTSAGAIFSSFVLH